MGVLMGHCRSEARDRYKEGKAKPSWCEEEIWEIIKDERDNNPNKYEQQVRARAQQSSSQTSHLGSGGKQAFKRDFVSFQKYYKYFLIYIFLNEVNVSNNQVIFYFFLCTCAASRVWS